MRRVLFFILFSGYCSLYSQSTIACKSGQSLVLNEEGTLVYSNIDSLVMVQGEVPTQVKSLYYYLLQKEQVNRIEMKKVNTELAIASYELSKADKDNKKNLQSNISKLKANLSKAVKLDNEITKEINIARSGIPSKVNPILKKYDFELLPLPSKSNKKNTPTKDTTSVIAIDESSKNNSDIVVDTLYKAEEPIQDTFKNQVEIDPSPVNEPKSNVLVENVNKNARSVEVWISPEDSCNVTLVNNKYIKVAQKKLIGYTPAKMRNYFKARDFLHIDAGLTKIKNQYYLDVTCNFSSNDALKSYGVIHKTDFLRLEFVGGKKIFLKAEEVDLPYIEKNTGNTIYKARYAFANKDDFKRVKSLYLNKLGILWSSGFEAYTVYNVDHLMMQYDCLIHAKN